MALITAGCDQKEGSSGMAQRDITFYSSKLVDDHVETALLKIHGDSITFGYLGWKGTDEYYTYRVDSMQVHKGGDVTFFTPAPYLRRHIEYDAAGSVYVDTTYQTQEYVLFNGFLVEADSTAFTHKFFDLFDSKHGVKGDFSKEVEYQVDSVR